MGSVGYMVTTVSQIHTKPLYYEHNNKYYMVEICIYFDSEYMLHHAFSATCARCLYRPIARDVIIEFCCSIRKINAHAWRTTRILSMAKCTEVVFAASLSTNEGSAHLRLTVC